MIHAVSSGPASMRVFLLSPARCDGVRARQVLRGEFELARRIRSAEGAPLGEIFSFMSGLYFRGKLIYSRTFARPPAGLPGVMVITPGAGLVPPETPIGLGVLEAFAQVEVHPEDARFRVPLEADVRRMASRLRGRCQVVLLGSIATGKYVDVLEDSLGERLCFPSAFVGRGDMSRGGLLLRAVDAGVELAYEPIGGAVRRGPRPPRLPPRVR